MNFNQTKDEKARRRAAKIGVSHNESKITQERRTRQQRELEAFAREMGVPIDYDSTRTNGHRLYRSSE